MVRWLAVGPEFNVHSDLPYTIVDWTDEYNIKDNDAVFFDLKTIYSDPTSYHSPSSSTPDAIEFPSRDAVAKHTWNNNDIFVRLPPKIEVSVPITDREKEDVNLLEWLPFDIQTDSTECGEKVSIPIQNLSTQKESTSQRDWRWYFTPPQFNWQLRLMGITSWPDEQPNYSHSVIQRADDSLSRYARRDGSPSKGALKKIATTNADELIAAKLVLEDTHKYSGKVYLLPSRQESFSEFVVDILQQWYGYDANVVRTNPSPLWAKEVTVVGERDLKGQLSELEAQVEKFEQEVARRTGFKRLLYDTGDILEELVRDAFREFGFSVEGEEPGKWDGVIQFEDQEYILEVTGTSNGISESKLSQLERHRRTYTSKRVASEDIYTLLVANTFRDDPPANRVLNEGNFIGSIQETNKRVMTTKTLYCLLNAYFVGETDEDQIQHLICDSKAIIRYDHDDHLWEHSDSTGGFSSRVSDLLKKMTRGLL